MTRVVRDPIHGLIELTEPEWAAVDTPVFQRLRHVRQLALTNLVYPGTVHTRFEHSIGVRYVAAQLAEAVELDEEKRLVVCAAALTHDVGHGAFSHVSEQVLEERAGRGDVHEAISVGLLRFDSALRQALGSDICDAAADLIGHVGPRTVARDIVSGPTDADKLDYLLRDSYFAGVQYGVYDIHRIVRTARSTSPENPQSQLQFSAGGLWAIEGLLLARHHMHRQVYGHKTRVATDIMLTRALRAGLEEELLPAQAYDAPFDEDGHIIDDAEFFAAYLTQTDSSVLATLAHGGEGSVARDLAVALTERRLLRQSVALPLHAEKERLGGGALSHIRDPEVFDRAHTEEIARVIADHLGEPEHLVALAIDRRRNPTYRTPGRSEGGEILFEREDRPPAMLEWVSEIFRETAGEEHVWANLYTPPLDDQRRDSAKDLVWQHLEAA